ncbi:MAG: prepilin-type N-terminal cleavage/methylation domain-containing protein [Thalassotalea sp.]
MKRIKSNTYKRKGLGFSLIEVLVGVAIAAVGVVGVVELQKKFITSGNEVNARAIAMQLIREKFDAVKAVDDFTTIAASTSTVDKSNYNFTRSAAATDYYYDSGSGAWGNTSTSTNRLSGKSLKVTVAWTDIKGNRQSIYQTQFFSKISLHDSDSSTNDIGDKTTPKVPFDANQTPESPPIELIDDSFVYEGVGNSKETSKPIPTVYGFEDNNVIQFETAVYDPSSDTQTLEDFATVNCSCTHNGTGSGAAPTTYRISDDGGSLVNDETSGEMVTKAVGTAVGSKQPALCDTCCRDHHDSTSVTTKYSSLSSPSVNHSHYNAGLDESNSGSYIEACRLRRVDGFYKVVPDWNLIDVVVMPISYFNSPANVNEYVGYVKSIVKSYMLGNALPTEDEKLTLLPNRDLTIAPGAQQLIARGIYVDTASLNSTDLATIKGYVSTKANWLEYVPFYEVNLSLFGSWASANESAVTVTNEDINTIVDVDNNYYGTYSRGRINALSVVDSSEVSVSVFPDNTGVTGTAQIAPSITPLNDSINVVVDNNSGGGIGASTYSLTIEINCLAFNNKGVLAACKNADSEGVNFSIISSTSISCVYSPQRGSSTAFLGCSAVPENWSGVIKLSNAGFTFAQSDYIYSAISTDTTDSAQMSENP